MTFAEAESLAVRIRLDGHTGRIGHSGSGYAVFLDNGDYCDDGAAAVRQQGVAGIKLRVVEIKEEPCGYSANDRGNSTRSEAHIARASEKESRRKIAAGASSA